MKRTETKRRGSRFCTLEVELKDGRLSICGTAGRVVTRREARREARQLWESFFEDDPAQIYAMNERMGRQFRTPRGAARFVLETDGELHGVDVYREDGDEVWITRSGGQIRKTIRRFFPNAARFFPWHLNDMNAGCEHQDARGESYDTHPGVECLQCGWKLGHGWHKRELPAEVQSWAETGEGAPPAPRQGPPMQVFALRGKRRRMNSLSGERERFRMRGWATSCQDAERRAEAILRERYDHISFGPTQRIDAKDVG